MAISSDEAIAKAREFANKVGWFTPRARVKEDASLIPAVWKVRLKGEYEDITIEVNLNSGDIGKWHSQDPLLVAFERVKPIIDKLEAQGHQAGSVGKSGVKSKPRCLRSKKGLEALTLTSLLFLKNDQLISNDSHRKRGEIALKCEPFSSTCAK